MKATTRVWIAARLMAHIEDLSGLRHFTAQELPLIQEALMLLIWQIQQEAAPHQAALPLHLSLPLPQKTYVFEPKNAAPDRLIVYERGQPERRLQHIPIFSYGFGLAGLPALDAALAILADFFGETLSRRAFAAGEGYSCVVYDTFAKEVLANPRARGRFETKRIVTFLRREESKRVPALKCEEGEQPSNGSTSYPQS